MTREEVIAFFRDMNECTYGNLEAADMAIKALEQEPCKDAISREDLKEPKFIIAENDYQKGWNDALDSVYENAPSIQQKKGRWIKTPKAVMGEGYMWYCDKCEHQVYQDSSRPYPSEKYCPNCGQPKIQEVENDDIR